MSPSKVRSASPDQALVVVDELRGVATATAEHARIRKVLDTHGFNMVFQPIYDLSTARPVAFEALARFVLQPYREPRTWFAEAHAVGLGVELELAAVRRALARIDMLPPGVSLFVNASPATTSAPGFLSALSDVDPALVVVELNDRVTGETSKTLTKAAATLRRAHVRFAVDDVGASLATVGPLLRLKADFVKIDESITHHLDLEGPHALAAGLVGAAERTGARLVAKGIETAAELAAVREVGIPLGQGMFLGEPYTFPARRRTVEV